VNEASHNIAERARVNRPGVPQAPLVERLEPWEAAHASGGGPRASGVSGLGVTRAAVVGHDIGLMVAYAYAAQFPKDVEKLMLMDAFLPGVDGWEPIYNNPAIWHFRFNCPTPEPSLFSRLTTGDSGHITRCGCDR
jgi:hypothetical protein